MRLDDKNWVGLAGDWHGNLHWAASVIEAFHQSGIHTIYHAGDFGIWPGYDGENYVNMLESVCESYGTTIIVAPGNHEDYTQIENEEGVLQEFTPHIFIAPRGYVLHHDHSGRNVMFFGGANSIDYDRRRSGRDWWPEESITESDLARLDEIEAGSVDVLIMHDAPDDGTNTVERIFETPTSFFSERGHNYAKQGRHAVNEVRDRVNPSMFVHGHMHVTAQRVDSESGIEYIALGPDGEPGNMCGLNLADLTVEWLPDAEVSD